MSREVFNLYESRHHGYKLNHMLRDEMNSFLNDEDGFEDYNPVVLYLRCDVEYWISISQTYSYFSDSNNYTLSLNKPVSKTNDLVFHLRCTLDVWEATLVK